MFEIYRDAATGAINNLERVYIAHRQEVRRREAAAGDCFLSVARAWFRRGKPTTAALIKRAIRWCLLSIDAYQRAGLGLRAETVCRYVRLLRHEYHRIEAEEGFRG